MSYSVGVIPVPDYGRTRIKAGREYLLAPFVMTEDSARHSQVRTRAHFFS